VISRKNTTPEAVGRSENGRQNFTVRKSGRAGVHGSGGGSAVPSAVIDCRFPIGDAESPMPRPRRVGGRKWIRSLGAHTGLPKRESLKGIENAASAQRSQKMPNDQPELPPWLVRNGTQVASRHQFCTVSTIDGPVEPGAIGESDYHTFVPGTFALELRICSRIFHYKL
jgi:hypothetical protein